jgi:peptidyl-prolyl cis-trans isomerase SurA
MRKLVLTCLASGLFITSALAQTLFTYGNNPVSKEDFLRVYQKNSLNKKPDYSETALREYLDLYSLFRMKVKEAELQHIDTMTGIQQDLDNYRRQIAKSYLTDEQVVNKLILESYERLKEEIHVAHIVISVPYTSNDTAAAYARIDSVYKAITKNKADFAALAKAVSDDRGSKDQGGDIGYITALQTVYPFENAAYTTPVGKVSAPFRSQLGYHIVKVFDKRQAQGEIQVAQVLIEVKKSMGEEGQALARKRVDSVQNDLKKGVSFDALVQKYSDDRFTKKDNGVMPWFAVGKMDADFENAAFALKKPGDISAPVQTEYGFHIIKLIARSPLKPYDSMKNYLTRKVNNDGRAQVAKEAFFNKIKAKNGYKEYPANIDAVVERLAKIPDTGKDANKLELKDFADMNKPVFTLGGVDYKQSDFIAYADRLTNGRLSGPKKAVGRDMYKLYVTSTVNDIEEHRLAETQPEFKNLMTEYRDGIMLFELMDRSVWGKASKDTTGLRNFYEQKKANYMWEPGFTGSVYHFKNEEQMKKGVDLLKKNTSDEEMIKQMNSNNMQDAVLIQRGHFEFSKFNEVPRSTIKAKTTTQAVKNSDGVYTVVRIDEVFEQPSQKSLSDARGYVIAEYQDYLEKEWNAEMKKKYPVKVEEPVFKSMVK